MQDIEEHKRYTSMYAQYQYNIKQAGTLRSELEKSDVIYDIADKAVMIVGLLTGDLGLRKRMNTNRERVLSIIAAHGSDSSGLIAILQDVQAAYNYLSEENLTLIADTLGISISKVYSVATFYENFSLDVKGKYCLLYTSDAADD